MSKIENWKIRKNSLRLRGFNYSSAHSNFVTIVTEPRRDVFNDSRIAGAVIEILLNLHEKYHFNLYSYCLMPDHFHALIGIGESNLTLGRICGAFKSISIRKYWEFGNGKLWQRQCFDHIIRNETDFLETIDYIRQNPVKANLVRRWDEWPYTGEPDLKKFYQ
jgi:putative transposase